MKKINYHFVLFLFISTFFTNCKKSDPDPPKLSVNSSSISLGDITSSSKSILSLSKTGEGTITYTATSSANWLKIDKTSGTLTTTDNINLTTTVPSSDLVVGENTATITITPTINGQVSSASTVTVKGTYKVTTVVPSVTSIDFGTIKTAATKEITLTKVGTEALTYSIASDKSWLNIDKTTGSISTTENIVLSTNLATLPSGAQTANITITPKSNGVAGTPIVIPVKVNYDDSITGVIEGHTLSKNETWGGNITLNGDIDVPSQYQLTILPGTKITVKTTDDKDLVIECTGKLVMDGTADKIIEIRSDKRASNSDWLGFEVIGDVSASYCEIENATYPFNFIYAGLFGTPTKAPSLHHLLFINNYTSIAFFSSKFASTISNITFKSGGYLPFFTAGASNLTVSKCDFPNNVTMDLILYTDNQKINIDNSNFVKKSYSNLYNCDVYYDETAEKHYVNNTVTINNCYGFNSMGPGFGINNNLLTQTNTASTAIANVGCGFESKYSSARIIANKKPTAAELKAVKKAIISKIKSAKK